MNEPFPEVTEACVVMPKSVAFTEELFVLPPLALYLPCSR